MLNPHLKYQPHRRTLPLNYNGNAIIGRVIDRGSNSASDAENTVIFLKKDNQESFIITGYPEK
ncbi:RNase A-like domain-containing protein [Bacillus mycoides]|uniref:RNase A-like domain-containing protein n=1 Tax=Bacillus mycoides TaxID=1405 RepID=UPI002AA85759|nr:RNase A-like domain-containing protein [Bacillus mycoides]